MGLFSLGNDWAEKQGLVDQRTPEQAVLQSIAIPKSPAQQLVERDGGLKTAGKMFLNSLSGGLLTPVLHPELNEMRAQYATDAKTYKSQQEQQQKQLQRQQLLEQSQPHFEGLSNDTEDDDLEHLRKLAMLQPEVYRPVLESYEKNRLSPNKETFTEGDYEWNPETGRWDYVQVGNYGTINRTPQHENFKPASRMASGQWIEEKTDETQTIARGHERAAGEAEYILKEMSDLGEENWVAGLQAEGSELYKRITGQEDQITAIRKEYEGVRVRNAISNLPPGVASDKDIQLALSPWPAGTANYTLIQKKLEAISRIERGRAVYERFRSNYIAEKGTFKGLPEAWDQSPDRLPDEKPSRSEFDTLWNGEQQ